MSKLIHTPKQLFKNFYRAERLLAESEPGPHKYKCAGGALFIDVVADATCSGQSGSFIGKVASNAAWALELRKRQHLEPSRHSGRIQMLVYGRVRRTAILADIELSNRDTKAEIEAIGKVIVANANVKLF